MSQLTPQHTATQNTNPPPAATQPPRSGCAYLLTAAIIGAAAATAWIYDMAYDPPINHGVLVGGGLAATVAACVGVVRNSEARRQYQIDAAREEGFDRGYARGVERTLNCEVGKPQLRSVSRT